MLGTGRNANGVSAATDLEPSPTPDLGLILDTLGLRLFYLGYLADGITLATLAYRNAVRRRTQWDKAIATEMKV